MADDKSADAKEWTSFASKDLDVAVHLLETFRPMPLEIICFHCQQAAERLSEWRRNLSNGQNPLLPPPSLRISRCERWGSDFPKTSSHDSSGLVLSVDLSIAEAV